MVIAVDDPSAEQGRELLLLCRAGRLRDIENWIAQGKPLQLPPRRKKTLLQVAVGVGFHSLVDLIAKHDTDQSSKNGALFDAVRFRRLDLVELLVEHGAEIRSVPFANVLLEWNPQMIRFFLEHGADVVADSPFAVAFGAKIRTALNVFRTYREAHPELATKLQQQLDSALRYFCRKGDPKWINLLTWAGADPRSMGPALEEEYTNDPECYTSGLREACYAGNLDALKKFKPDPGRDDMEDLLHCACVSGRKDAVQFLLEHGADPNSKGALDSCLWHLNFGSYYAFSSREQRSRYQVSSALNCVRELVEHGALWKPEKHQINAVRRALLGCEPKVTVELLQIFVSHKACGPEVVQELLRTPRMKGHLSPVSWHLARLGVVEKPAKSKRMPPPAPLLAKYNREELYKKLWAQPTRAVAKEYGVSDVWLGTVCKVLLIPLPGRGYWAKLAAGVPVKKQPPLPALMLKHRPEVLHK